MEPDVTLGEVVRRVDRLDQEVQAGFRAMREQMERLQFVPAAVYASDRSGDQERIRRLERVTEEAEKERDRRAWQTRLSLLVAFIGLPLSVLGALVVALILGKQ